MTPACGIDFGTSNSSIAISQAGLAPAAADPERRHFRPHRPVLQLRRRYHDVRPGGAGALFRARARSLPARHQERARHQAVRGHDAGQIARYGFGEIIAAFLHSLRSSATDSLGAPPTRVVLGRPAFFVDDNPEPTPPPSASWRQPPGRPASRTSPSSSSRSPPPSTMSERQRRGDRAGRRHRRRHLGLLGGAGLAGARAVSDRRQDILGFTGVHIGGTDFDKQLAWRA